MLMRPVLRHPWLAFAALLLLIGSVPQRCRAEILIGDITPERAKQLGITVHVQPRAEDVWVRVQFKTTGALKGFRYGELELTQGGKRLLSAALMARKPTAQSPAEAQQLEFYVDPAALPNASVMVVAYSRELGGEGYRLRMKDYLPKGAR
jgi:hypothetical protein